MLDFDCGRPLDAEHQRGRFALFARRPPRPIELDRFATGGDFRAGNIRPSRHQFRRSKTLPREGVAHDLADKIAQRLGRRTRGLVQGGLVHGGLFMADLFITRRSVIGRSMTLPAKRGRKKSPRLDQDGAGGKQQAPEAAELLAWYDRHRRALPWRARPGERADPYRVWLSEIMLQQTTVKAVAPYYARFLRSWPDLRALAAASLDEVLTAWAGLGYYARARNMHACARALIERHGGEFPASESALCELPGIGGYTAAAIAAIAFAQVAM